MHGFVEPPRARRPGRPATCALLVVLSGCAAPSGALELITVARSGLDSARRAENDAHADTVAAAEARTAALDTAFDADVRLVAGGQVRGADGKPVRLTPEWVIDARRGYAAARDLLSEDLRAAEAAHTARLDNLAASDEALQMAAELIVRQWDVDERVRRHVLNAQRRYLDARSRD